MKQMGTTPRSIPPLPPELLHQIALQTPLGTICTFRRANTNLLHILPSGHALLQREYDHLVKNYTIDEALGRALVRDYCIDRCAKEIGEKAHMMLVKMLIKAGAQWVKAFVHVWDSNDGRAVTYQKQALDANGLGPFPLDDDDAGENNPVRCDLPKNSTLYGVWLYEVQMAVIRRWCKMFGKSGDVEVIRSFVPVLGVFEVAALTGCTEIVKEAQEIWTDWR